MSCTFFEIKSVVGQKSGDEADQDGDGGHPQAVLVVPVHVQGEYAAAQAVVEEAARGEENRQTHPKPGP